MTRLVDHVDPPAPLPPPTSFAPPIARWPPPVRRRVRIVWVAGPDAGGRVDLEPGRWFVGRAKTAHVRCEDMGLALHHALVEIGADGSITLTQLAGRAPMTTDGGDCGGALTVGSRVRLGASVIEIRDASSPPCGAVSELPQCVDPLTTPTDHAIESAFGGRLTPAVAGVAIAVVLSLVTRQPWFAAAGLLGGIVAMLIWSLQKAGELRATGAASHERDAALATFAEQVAQQRHAARVAHLTTAPSLERALGSVTADAVGDATDTTEGPTGPGALRASIGIGDVGWSPDVVGPPHRGGSAHWAVIASNAHLAAVPVVVELGAGTVLAIVGGEVVRAVVRAILLQLVGERGPDRLRIAIHERVDGCEMFDRVPHHRSSDTTTVDDTGAITVGIETAAAHRTGPSGGAAIVICSSEASVPHDATSILITSRDGRARWIADVRASALAEPVSFAGISAERAAVAVQHLTNQPPVVKVEALCRESSPWAPPSSVPCNAPTTATASSPV